LSTATAAPVEVQSWSYVNLNDVDPNFTAIPDDFYNLGVIQAELKPFDKTATGGTKGEFVKLAFSIRNHPTLTGRRVYPDPMFLNNFNLAALRRIMDATGVQQAPGESLESWLKSLQAVGPTVKLKVETIPDVNFKTGVPNPYSMKPDGSPGTKTIINYKAGVQPED
jgi:hypothetical protein